MRFPLGNGLWPIRVLVAWLDGLVEILVSVEFTGSPQEPTSYPRLQDFLDTLQSFEACLRFQATGFSGYVAKL